MTEQHTSLDQIQTPKKSFFSKHKGDEVQKEEIQPNGHSSKWKWLLVAILMILGLIVGGISISAYRYIQVVEASSGLTVNTLLQKVQTGWQLKLFEDTDRIQVLVYGLDAINGDREASMLTDTILLVSIAADGRVDLISIPRDLWIASLQTKINALFYYGEESEETTGVELLSTVVEEITGQTIDYHLELSLDDVVRIVEAMGGVDIEVQAGFVDEKFPRKGVDISSEDPDVLYESVEFQPGLQTMNSDRVEKYIRSRNSQNESEGNDVARTVRQQQVILGLVQRLQQAELWFDPLTAGNMYTSWSQIETNIQDEVIIALAKQIVNQDLIINSHTITSAEHLENEVLIVPPIEKYNAWVYEPVDPTWEELQAWIAQQLRN